ncbi:hypothetical protein Pmar_PMAR006144 [Perkinsus marinus ATCC 50983]|uniref:Tyr recombinase domain-containing protein n=1 Tax=Perkinsus marinus (strain ATCC 50983 / TXsc) TaxID=423536 RepID=C5LAC0_PERM5|nr:hypothetical protein Pmar_PMAR006144 [Perkinsus marinus ATCC 50983]EER06376.1 hypothetical protein Pmar_PMAR006144 [Perkinsus marinus ATCC 50983]|eukprot:XP_002774560.1 hypothetical protein Pmar_PMAR006144 [Perkinsus marinus ATCC 50983]
MYETIYKYVNTIRIESRLFEVAPLSVADEEYVRLALQSAKRILRNRKQKRTVTLTLDQIKRVVCLTPPSGRAISEVAFLTGIFCLLRLKEVASLTPADVTTSLCGSYLKVYIRCSKTDQSGSGQTVILGCSHGKPCGSPCGDRICPMHRLMEVLSNGPEIAAKPTLFGLSYNQLSKDINALVETVFRDTDPELEVGRKTSHSMRRTGVCLLADAKVPLHEIAEYGRWKDATTVENVYLRDRSHRASREKHYSGKMLACLDRSDILVPASAGGEQASASSSSAVEVDFVWDEKPISN